MIPLTNMYDDEFETALKQTPPGMAYLAGSGPDLKRCQQCVHFYYDKGKPDYWAASNKLMANGLKPARCSKYKDMSGAEGKKFPATSRACKYFYQSASPPPEIRRL